MRVAASRGNGLAIGVETIRSTTPECLEPLNRSRRKLVQYSPGLLGVSRGIEECGQVPEEKADKQTGQLNSETDRDKPEANELLIERKIVKRKPKFKVIEGVESFRRVDFDLNVLKEDLDERRNEESYKRSRFKCSTCILSFDDKNELSEHNRECHDEISEELQQAGQHVEAYLKHDGQKLMAETNTNESVLVLIIPSTSNNELYSSEISISNQKTDEIILNLPDNFIVDCSLENPTKEIIYSNKTGQIIDDVVLEELSSSEDQQDFDIICNDSQSCNDETMSQSNAGVTTESVSISLKSPFRQGTVFTTDQTDIEIPTANIEKEHNEAATVNENKMTNEELEDMEYIPIEKDEDEENSEIIVKPSRGRKRKIADQNKYIRKKRANTNQDYVSVKGKLVKSKTFTGYNFDCHCSKKCTQKISAEERESEFNNFWNAGSYEARCALLQCYVKEIIKNRSYKSQSTKRLYTRKYYMRDKEICKTTLLNTLSISQTRIDIALTKHRNNEGIRDKRGNKPITAEQLKEMRDLFIEHLPRYMSHCCRESSSANYLAPKLSMRLLYDKYKTDRTNAKIGTHVCDICQCRFSERTQLVSHSRSHFSEFYCRLCSYRCSSEEERDRHGRTHQRAIECLECGQLFENHRQFNDHYKEIHETFTCDHCGLTFKMKLSLLKHISKKHTKPECKICDKTFSKYMSLVLHNKVFHGPPSKSAYCEECDLKFTDIYSYKMHLANSVKHKPKKIGRFPCPECDKCFTKEINLTDHYELHHLKLTKFKCVDCEKTNNILARHVSGHECARCAQTFALPAALTAHIRTEHID
ncbi:unnamed protein product [Euphydryas editha]|uniref:C2H2-type domain-containing protein n=1 Tax=Euphydryas editha TaxID=104508 RepID=A0AAU9T9L8_EUPED|nr:unnamed protein product [Euphydryas editha]